MNKNTFLLLITAASVAVMGLIWCGQLLISFSMFYSVIGMEGRCSWACRCKFTSSSLVRIIF
jgi:hypothetical protein